MSAGSISNLSYFRKVVMLKGVARFLQTSS
jgi:hypothetical protein